MQITLKVKSTSSLDLSSVKLTLLTSSKRWLCITVDGKVTEQSAESYLADNVEATPSLWHISVMSQSNMTNASINCVSMCLADTRTKLDPVEFECLVKLANYC